MVVAPYGDLITPKVSFAARRVEAGKSGRSDARGMPREWLYGATSERRCAAKSRRAQTPARTGAVKMRKAVAGAIAFRHHGQMGSQSRFRYRLRVRFAEIDAQGFVFNGNYLTYCDVAWTEYFRALGLSYADMVSRGVDMVLVGVVQEFKSPAVFDEILEIAARVLAIGNTSINFEFEISGDNDGRLVHRARSTYVTVDPNTKGKITVPDFLRQVISNHEGIVCSSPSIPTDQISS
jgi:acyl-CoA thioester hydrolase